MRTRRIAMRAWIGLFLIGWARPGGAVAQSFDIQAAIDAANDGDVVEIPAGVYHQALRIDPKPGLSHFTLRGAADGGTVLDLAVREFDEPGFPGFTETLSMIQVGAGAAVTIEDVAIQNQRPMGGFPFVTTPSAIVNAGRLVLTRCRIADNSGSAQGGGIQNGPTGDLEMVRCQMTGNVAGLTGFRFGGGYGGAIFNAGRLTVRGSLIRGNSCGGAGGGLFNAATGNATLVDSTLAENGASSFFGGLGGGIDNAGHLLLRQCTLSGNSAQGLGGGGLHAAQGAETIVQNCTITGNTGSQVFFFLGYGARGGGIFSEGGVVIRSSIVAKNDCQGDPQFGGCLGQDIFGGVTSEGFNLIGRSEEAWVTPALSTDQLGTARRPLDPQLKPLADHGGPTPTHELSAASPAIDRGFSATDSLDQRGERRISDDQGVPNAPNGGGCDIGAFEFIAPVPRQSSDRPADFPQIRLSKGGIVRAVVATPSGGFFVGGSFSAVNGEPRGNLAKFDRDGVLDPRWRPAVNGEVLALALGADALFVGGVFDEITVFPDSTLPISRQVSNLAKLDLRRNSRVIEDWGPNPDNAIRALAVSGTNLFVGGSFSRIAGLDRSFLAWLTTTAAGTNAATLAWDPAPDSLVRALAIGTNELFVGGDFGRINGQERRKLARLRLTEPEPNAQGRDWLDPDWAIGVLDSLVTNTVAVPTEPGGTNLVLLTVTNVLGTVSALRWAEDRLYVGGEFSRVGELQRQNLARVSVPVGLPASVDAQWSPNPDGPVRMLELGSAEPSLFVGGRFRQIAGVARTNLAKLDAQGNAVKRWAASPNGEVQALCLNGPSLYVGGDFTLAGGEVHAALAKLDPVSARVDSSFGAAITEAGEVRSIARQPDGKLILGGDFLFANELPRAYLARVQADGTLDAAWAPSPDGVVELVLTSGAEVYVAGAFKKIGGLARNGLAKLSASNGDGPDADWNPNPDGPVNTWALAGTDLMLAGAFRHFGDSPVDGLAKVSRAGTGRPDLAWRPAISALLTEAAVLDPVSLVAKLDVPEASGIPLSGLIRGRLPQVIRDALVAAANTGVVSVTLVSALVSELNQILRGPPLYDENLFAGFPLRAETRWLLDQRPVGEELVRLNRLLLEDVYVGEFVEVAPQLRGDQVAALVVSGDLLFAGGEFAAGDARNLVRLGTTGGGTLDLAWAPNPDGPVHTLALAGPDLYVGGAFHEVGPGSDRVNREGVCKLRGVVSSTPVNVDLEWDPRLGYVDIGGVVRRLAVGDAAVYLAGRFNVARNLPRLNLAKLDSVTGQPDPNWTAYANGPVDALLTLGDDLYLGGRFDGITRTFRGGFAFLPTLAAPVVLRSGDQEVRLYPDPSDGAEVAGFVLTSITGGTMQSDGVTVTNGSFIPLATAAKGLTLVPEVEGGRVDLSAVAARTPTLRGFAVGTTTDSTNLVPIFAFGQRNYTVREGRGAAVVTVIRLSPGAGSVRYQTRSGTGEAGVKYQEQNGGVFFDATSTEQSIRITVADELQRQGDQTFTVTLLPTSGGRVAEPSRAVVTIQDNDIVGDSHAVLSSVPPSPLQRVETLLSADCLGDKPPTAGWRLHGESVWHPFDTQIPIHGASNNYLLEFKPVAGFSSPQPITVPLDGASPVLNVASSEAYFSRTNDVASGAGNLRIDLLPRGAVLAEAQWRLEDGEWQDAGAILTNVTAGLHLAEFRDVNGYQAPPARHVLVVTNQLNGYAATYLIAPPVDTQGVTQPVRVDFAEVQAGTNNALLFNGQILTEQGWGTGVAVKTKVVLTAAHVVLDDNQPTNRIRPESIRWLFQKDASQFLPPSQSPRGLYLLDGYAAQRQVDRTPGVSSSLSRSLDAAALYFLESVGRGGSSGFVVSDQVDNEWLLSQRGKVLAGYPVKNPPIPAEDVGSLFATPSLVTAWRHFGADDELVFSTPAILSLPGASGGALYVRADDLSFYPAGIYLGVITNANRQEAVVRAIDSRVVDIINRAEVSGNGGGNFNDSTKLAAGDGAGSGLGALQVDLSPPEAVRSGARWAFADDLNQQFDSGETLALQPGSYHVLATSLNGFRTPSPASVKVVAGATATVTLQYQAANPQPQTITFLRPGGGNTVQRVFGDGPLDIEARASSGRPVALSLAEGALLASLSEGRLTLRNSRDEVGIGQVVVRATVPGDEFDFLPATQDLTVTIVPQPVEVVLENLAKVFDGVPAAVTARASVAGLSVRISYGNPPSDQPPSGVGTYPVKAEVLDPNFVGSATALLAISAQGQTLDFPPLADRVYGDPDFEIRPRSDAGLPVTLTVSGPARLASEIVTAGQGSPVTLTGVGEVTISAAQGGDASHAPAAPVTRRFLVGPRAIRWEFGPLRFVYDGQPKPLSVVTDPAAVPVTVRYERATSAPVGAGTYDVEAEIASPLYAAPTPLRGQLVITKAAQLIRFDGTPSGVRVGAGDVPIVAVSSAGLPVSLTLGDGSPAALFGANLRVSGVGQVRLLANQAGDANHEPASARWEITATSSDARVLLDGLRQTYNGRPRIVTVSTVPESLPVSVTYDGSPLPPISGGSYRVVATVTDPRFAATESQTLVVDPATQSIDFPEPPALAFGDPPLTLVATASSGLPVSFSWVSGPGGLAGSRTLTNSGAGEIVMLARQWGDDNYAAAPEVERRVTVRKGRATVLLAGSKRVYDGTPQESEATSQPPGLALEFLYDGRPAVPTNSGSYLVEVRVVDPDYEGSARGPWEIVPAPAIIAFDPARLKQRFDGRPKVPVVDTLPPGLPVVLRYDGALSPPVEVGSYLGSAEINDPNYRGTTNQVFTVFSSNAPPSEFSGVERDRGAIVLRWKVGALQSVESLPGPWTDVAGARSPLVIAPQSASRFYRLRD